MEKKRKRKIILWAVVVAAVLALFFTYIPFSVLNSMVDRHVDFEQVWSAAEYGIAARAFSVTTRDGLRISAHEVAADDPKAVIVCLSGIHNPSVAAFFGHARLFRERGYASVLVEMRAHGASEGNLICLGYKEHLDVRAVVDWIGAQPTYRNVPIVACGLSMGGASAIIATGKIAAIDGLVSLSAYSSWQDVFVEGMSVQAPALLARIVKPFSILAASIRFGVNGWRLSPKKEIAKLGRRPALLMHSRGDSQVPFANLERLRQRAPAHVETFVREGDLHFLTEHFTEPEKDAEYAQALLGFLERHFPGGK
ncbi:MAG: alpha/beta hydrolase [Candidatus Aminicenantes bacterium]|nr:alpha/beta hydrolase [Candidatus Aminicenantes bacterium]